jgi:hypothetical protein
VGPGLVGPISAPRAASGVAQGLEHVGVGPAAELFTAAPEVHAKPSLSQKSFQVAFRPGCRPGMGLRATRLVRVWSAKMSVTKVRHPKREGGRQHQQVKPPSVRPQISAAQSSAPGRTHTAPAGGRLTRAGARGLGPELELAHGQRHQAGMGWSMRNLWPSGRSCWGFAHQRSRSEGTKPALAKHARRVLAGSQVRAE